MRDLNHQSRRGVLPVGPRRASRRGGVAVAHGAEGDSPRRGGGRNPWGRGARGWCLWPPDGKSKHAIAYADAFAVATAVEFNATLLTGDPEIEPLEGEE